MRLVHISTSAVTPLAHASGQLRFMRERGFDVTVVSAPGPELDAVAEREGVDAIGIPMMREPAPVQDCVALSRLTVLLRKLRPDIVHCGTPKAGLLGGLAAWTNRVPVRVMWLHGLRSDGLTGKMRRVVISSEQLSCRTSHRVYCVGDHLRSRAIALKIAPAAKLRVLGSGTPNGVGAEEFSRTPEVMRRAEALRRRVGLPVDAQVIGFVGRIVRDKGVAELVAAFKKLRDEFPKAYLLLSGPEEDYDGLDQASRAVIAEDPRIIQTGFVDHSTSAYGLITVFALPTYREGFGCVLLEAAVMGLPVIGTEDTGCVDALVHGQTGTLVPAKDSDALAAALRTYLLDPALRRAHGEAGRARALRDFRPERLWDALYDEYMELLQKSKRHRRPQPAVAQR